MRPALPHPSTPPPRALTLACAAALCAALTGCVPFGVSNPTITASRSQAGDDLCRMEADPRPLHRPVVVLNGYRALAPHANILRANLQRATSAQDSDYLTVSYAFASSIEEAAQEVIAAVNARWPGDSPDETIEVDVVAVSMGGIVARYAALSDVDRLALEARWSRADGTGDIPLPRLRIARLFTLATPHRGARLADTIALDAAALEMRSGSAMLRALDAALPTADYELTCYGQLRDFTVGVTRTAPEGHALAWTDGTLMFSHVTIADNTLVLADIARRLRGEGPLLEPGPPPDED